MARGGLSPISIELAHVTHADLGSLPGATLEDVAAHHVRAAAQLLPAVRHVGEPSLVLLLDDYFASDSAWVDDALTAILDACSAHAITIDHVVRESRIAEYAHQVLELVVDDPRPGDGAAPGLTSDAGGRDPAWLSSDGRRRLGDRALQPGSAPTASLLDKVQSPTAPAKEAGEAQPPPHRGVRAANGYHELNLEVELFREEEHTPAATRKWSCPFLAACWQLLRLGVIQDDAGVPARPIAEQIDHPAVRESPAPFTAISTLTVLTPTLLEVEHAVRLILSRLQLDEQHVRFLTRPDLDSDRRPADVVLRQIAYTFLPVAHPLATSFSPTS